MSLMDALEEEAMLRWYRSAGGIKQIWEAYKSTPDDLRAKGLFVAAHNDYEVFTSENGPERWVFWLITWVRKDLTTLAFQGRGKTDREALDQIRAEYAKATDTLHHAPLCPANHYHGSRAPTSECSCGALQASKNSQKK